METDSSKIFISYKRDDKEKVLSIKDFIESNTGVKCWIDVDGIESDAQFANVIINAINKALVFLFMYSRCHSKIKDYANDWTVREINFAQKKRKRIVFVNIDDSPLTDWFELLFGTKQQVYYSSDSAMKNLIKDIRKWLKIEDDSSVEVSKESPTSKDATRLKNDTKKELALLGASLVTPLAIPFAVAPIIKPFISKMKDEKSKKDK